MDVLRHGSRSTIGVVSFVTVSRLVGHVFDGSVNSQMNARLACDGINNHLSCPIRPRPPTTSPALPSGLRAPTSKPAQASRTDIFDRETRGRLPPGNADKCNHGPAWYRRWFPLPPGNVQIENPLPLGNSGPAIWLARRMPRDIRYGHVCRVAVWGWRSWSWSLLVMGRGRR
jgi:hypothetical protein